MNRSVGISTREVCMYRFYASKTGPGLGYGVRVILTHNILGVPAPQLLQKVKTVSAGTEALPSNNVMLAIFVTKA